MSLGIILEIINIPDIILLLSLTLTLIIIARIYHGVKITNARITLLSNLVRQQQKRLDALATALARGGEAGAGVPHALENSDSGRRRAITAGASPHPHAAPAAPTSSPVAAHAPAAPAPSSSSPALAAQSPATPAPGKAVPPFPGPASPAAPTHPVPAPAAPSHGTAAAQPAAKSGQDYTPVALPGRQAGAPEPPPAAQHPAEPNATPGSAAVHVAVTKRAVAEASTDDLAHYEEMERRLRVALGGDFRYSSKGNKSDSL